MKADIYTDRYGPKSDLVTIKCIYIRGRTRLRHIVRFTTLLSEKNYWRTNES